MTPVPKQPRYPFRSRGLCAQHTRSCLSASPSHRVLNQPPKGALYLAQVTFLQMTRRGLRKICTKVHRPICQCFFYHLPMRIFHPINQQNLYRHNTGLPNILHQFASHFPHVPLSLMYITPVRRSSFRMRPCLSLLVRQPDTSEPHTTPSPASIASVVQQLVHK